MTAKERLNQRFAKDFNLPINIFNEDMFEYYHNLYKDFWPEKEWEALNKEIEDGYNGNFDSWLQHYAEIRDKIIMSVLESPAYKNFNSCDMNTFAVDTEVRALSIPDRTSYTEVYEGHKYLSLDLKKANFQALNTAGVLFDNSYEEFIDKFDKSFYFKKSKYTRQVIFGKLNPKRTTTVEKYIVAFIFKYLAIHNLYNTVIASNKGVCEPFSFKTDEFIWEVNGDITREDIENLEGVIQDMFGYHVRCEYYSVKKLPIVNANGTTIPAFVRTNLITGEQVLKSVSSIYFPQVYKLWKGMEIVDNDLLFWHEDQLAKFIKPLKLEQ